MEIKEVLRRAFKYGEIADIKRMRYEPYKMEVALEAIRIIGTSITPKFVIDGENQWVFEQLIKWMHGDESMMAIDPATGGQIQGRLKSGIYLGGNTGSGKSLALQVMSIYRNIDNIQIRINGEMYRPSVQAVSGGRNLRHLCQNGRYLKVQEDADFVCAGFRQRGQRNPIHGQPHQRDAADYREPWR